MQWRKFTRLKTATGHSRTRRMLCCGRRKENGRSVPDLTASPGRAPPGPMPNQQGHQQYNQQQQAQMQQQQQRQGVKEPVLLQGDFRKVSGISSEIFRQIEAVENDHDPSTAAALEAVERRGEMIVRILEPRCIGGRQAVEAAQKLMAKGDARHTVQLVEIVKRPGQTLGLYIREGNGADRSDGVFISRIALESAVYNSGCLRVGDEILAVNLVDVTHMSLDDVVIIMSIPRRLVLAIRQRRSGSRGGSNSPGPQPLSRPEQKPPPVVVMKRDLRDEELDEAERMSRSRPSRERRTGDGREMTESRSRLGLGLNNYSPQSEQLDLYYNSRPNAINEPPSWGYKPPPPPPSSVITEQPKSHAFAPSHSYYANAGTLESLAEKVHSFYPGPSRRMSAGTGVGMGGPSHARFPRSGSDQHLPRVEYADFSSSLGRHSLLRSSLKSSTPTGGGTLGRYGGGGGGGGRYEPPQSSRTSKYGTAGSGVPGASSTLTRRSRPNLDYSSDTEATIGPRPSYYYYNRPTISSTLSRGSTQALGGGPDMAKFNSLPRERPGARLGLRTRLGERLMDDSDGNLSAPELPARRERDLRSRISTSPSIFTSDEYRAWLRRAPSSSAICEQMRMSRDFLNQQRAHRFSCSAENIHDALKNTESIYSRGAGPLTGTLDRHISGPGRGITSLPVRSLSTQHIGGSSSSSSSIRSPSVRRMRQLLELTGGVGGAASPSGMSGGHQSPAPTPSATLPRPQRQIDINPAEFVKYKLDKPMLDLGVGGVGMGSGGVSGMLWIHLLAGRGLRSTTDAAPIQTRDLYCVLECDRVHKARTVVRSGDLQFDWDESFELDLVCNRQLDVLVYSWDPQHRHKLCFRGAVSLVGLLRQAPLHQLALRVEPRGTIYLRLRHTDPVTLYRRRGLPSLRASYPQLFGADLDTVVSREAKGHPGQAPVPIVLRRCVEEVERRGLDIIGLYRLCGSATKKRLLREAFERNSRAVELSPDHVPDINVITGVLKDYLRELPEPLFTRCLFQMTVDALAVCLPDDPEGNAKLMLSILDCLPRANRATLVFLLDHLSLVVSASERNKMSAQALATVMGPPLMLHSSSAGPSADIDHAQPIAVLKYLLQIWPQPHTATTGGATNSGRRGEPAGQRGNKASALPAVRSSHSNMALAANPHSSSAAALGLLHHSATVNTLQPYQSVVGQSAPSPRVMPHQVTAAHHQSVALADSVGRVLSPLPGTPSPGSSSASTNSSGSGTDTIKRGASPATSITSISTAKFRGSESAYSIKQHQPTESEELSNNKTINGTSNGPMASALATTVTTNNKTSTDLHPSRSVLFASSSLMSSSTSTASTTTASASSLSTSKAGHESSPSIASYLLKDYHQKPQPTPTATTTTSMRLNRNNGETSYAHKGQTAAVSSNSGATHPITSASSSLGIYQFPSSSISVRQTHPTPSSLSETLSTPQSASSPSRNSTSIARNNIILSEYHKNNHSSHNSNNTETRQDKQSTINSYVSSSAYSTTPSTSSSATTTNLYGTLPKISASNVSFAASTAGSSLFGSGINATSTATSQYSTDYQSQGMSTVPSSTYVTNGYNTIGSYRVQYSSTNPFLPSFINPPGSEGSNGGGPAATTSGSSLYGDKENFQRD